MAPNQNELQQLQALRHFKDRPPTIAAYFLRNWTFYAFVGVATAIIFVAGLSYGRPDLSAFVAGVAVAVLLRDIGRYRDFVRSWPLSRAITDWQRVDELLNKAVEKGKGAAINRFARLLVITALIAGVVVLLSMSEYRIPDFTDDLYPDYASTEPAYRQHALIQGKVGFYAVFLPPDYDESAIEGRRYPIVVILHGNGSDEIAHGRLSNDLGRDSAIYVSPRAPHESHLAFLELGQAGFSAWPDFPDSWGGDGDSFLPQESDNIDITQLYVDWIANTIADIRKRYRTDNHKVVVVGHSEGASIAFSFALRRPDLLSGFVSHAGRYYMEPLDEASADILSTNQIVPFISHYEGDRIVPIAESRRLVSFLRTHDVPHRDALLKFGNHGFGPCIIDTCTPDHRRL